MGYVFLIIIVAMAELRKVRLSQNVFHRNTFYFITNLTEVQFIRVLHKIYYRYTFINYNLQNNREKIKSIIIKLY